MPDPVYSLQGIQKSYEGRMVLDIERLEVLPGEILAIVGPSGAGKSTLLRLLNFLEYADNGKLTFNGQVVTPAIPIQTRREVTTVFQRPALLNASVEANIASGLQLRGLKHKDLVKALLQRLGLYDLRKAQARTLSGGEMQRAALARALVIEPRVLLLDEPTANLDPYHVGLIEEVIREVNQEHNITTLLVTHNIFQARRMANRLALMLNGKIIETGNSVEFFDQPKDSRTLAFVRGEMVY